jgi:Xaa-Pro aminopeptidase
VAVAGEVIWLAVAGRTPGYQRWAAEQSAGARRTQQAADTAQATRRLDDAYTARVNQLGRVTDEIRRLAAERGMDPATFDRGGDRLQALVQTFIQMSALHQRLVRFLGGSPAGNLDEEVARLSKDMAAEKDAGVRLTLRQTLTVAQRRQKQHEQIEGTRRALEAKMRTLEMSLDYLRSQVFAGGTEADLENQLDELAATVSFLPDLEAEATATIASARSTSAHPSPGATVS